MLQPPLPYQYWYWWWAVQHLVPTPITCHRARRKGRQFRQSQWGRCQSVLQWLYRLCKDGQVYWCVGPTRRRVRPFADEYLGLRCRGHFWGRRGPWLQTFREKRWRVGCRWGLRRGLINPYRFFMLVKSPRWSRIKKFNQNNPERVECEYNYKDSL